MWLLFFLIISLPYARSYSVRPEVLLSVITALSTSDDRANVTRTTGNFQVVCPTSVALVVLRSHVEDEHIKNVTGLILKGAIAHRTFPCQDASFFSLYCPDVSFQGPNNTIVEITFTPADCATVNVSTDRPELPARYTIFEIEYSAPLNSQAAKKTADIDPDDVDIDSNDDVPGNAFEPVGKESVDFAPTLTTTVSNATTTRTSTTTSSSNNSATTSTTTTISINVITTTIETSPCTAAPPDYDDNNLGNNFWLIPDTVSDDTREFLDYKCGIDNFENGVDNGTGD